MTKNFKFTKQQWSLIEKNMTGVEGRGGTVGKNNELFIQAVIYMGLSKTSWKKVPEEFGNGHAIYTRYRRWHVNGVWDVILNEIKLDKELHNLFKKVLPMRGKKLK